MARRFLHKALLAPLLVPTALGCIASFATPSAVEIVGQTIELHHVRKMGLFTFGIASGVLYSRSIEYSWRPEYDLAFTGIVVDNIHPQPATNELLIEGHAAADGTPITMRRQYVLMHDETEKIFASGGPASPNVVATSLRTREP